jgi:hypothetical protein
VNFRELYSLLKFSADNKFVNNPEFVQIFQDSSSNKHNFTTRSENIITTDISKIDFTNLPFLRSLHKDIVTILKKDSIIGPIN